jgi:hypothetical protein
MSHWLEKIGDDIRSGFVGVVVASVVTTAWQATRRQRDKVVAIFKKSQKQSTSPTPVYSIGLVQLPQHYVPKSVLAGFSTPVTGFSIKQTK